MFSDLIKYAVVVFTSYQLNVYPSTYNHTTQCMILLILYSVCYPYLYTFPILIVPFLPTFPGESLIISTGLSICGLLCTTAYILEAYNIITRLITEVIYIIIFLILSISCIIIIALDYTDSDINNVILCCLFPIVMTPSSTFV